MDFELARSNMVSSQIQAWDVSSHDVLTAIQELPREKFVPTKFKELSYSDHEIPLETGSCMLAPKVVGKILQAVFPLHNKIVLEIGTGSGYLTALLSKLSAQVTSIEISQELQVQATNNLGNLNINNIELIRGDATKDLYPDKTYDIVILTGSTPQIPEHIKKLVREEGKLFAVIGNDPIMQATLFSKMPYNYWEQRTLFETNILPLKNFQEEPTFEL